MDSIIFNGTWEVVEHPYGCKPVGCKWMFKKKFRRDGTIKYNARLVAKGEKTFLYLFTCGLIDYNPSTSFPGSLSWSSRSSDGC
jgi:hypothetical protein